MHPDILAELVRRDDLAARDAGDVGYESFDFGDSALLEPGAIVSIVSRHSSGRSCSDWVRSSCRLIAPARLAESLEQAAGECALLEFPLGMPLHAEREGRAALDAKGFDETVVRGGFDDE
jgi:hypothetical protein